MSFISNAYFLFLYPVENKQRGRFAGFSLYVSSNAISSTKDIQRSTQCYMNGNELPPLNFSTTCTEYGRYVVFYNERLTGAKYPSGYELDNVITELCEVIVHGKVTYYVTTVNE